MSTGNTSGGFGGQGPFSAWRGLFSRGGHDNAEKEQLKGTDKAPKDAAITDPQSNAIQQKEQLKMALKAFRFTKAQDKPFVIVKEDKHEVQDWRPMQGSHAKHAEAKSDAGAPGKHASKIHPDGSQDRSRHNSREDSQHSSSRPGKHTEQAHKSSASSDAPPEGKKQRPEGMGEAPVAIRTQNKIQKQAQEQIAMKIFRLTRDPGNAFRIDMGAGKEVSDKRPVNHYTEISDWRQARTAHNQAAAETNRRVSVGGHS